MLMKVPQTLDGKLLVPGQALPVSLSVGGVSCDTVPQGRVTPLCARFSASPAVFSRICHWPYCLASFPSVGGAPSCA